MELCCCSIFIPRSYRLSFPYTHFTSNTQSNTKCGLTYSRGGHGTNEMFDKLSRKTFELKNSQTFPFVFTIVVTIYSVVIIPLICYRKSNQSSTASHFRLLI